MLKLSKAVIKKNNKYLLFKRTSYSNNNFANVWDFAGGRFDSEENAEQALVREVKEETDLDVNPGKLEKTARFDDFYNKKKFDLLFHYFVLEDVKGEIKLSEEHSEYKWFSEIEIKNLKLHPAVSCYFS